MNNLITHLTKEIKRHERLITKSSLDQIKSRHYRIVNILRKERDNLER